MLPFLSAYDPLGGSSGSIDPLGALQTYGALADLLLPGVTTITTRSRYLSMLCASLANTEKYRNLLPGASGLSQRREAVEPFERFWALACVAAQKDGNENAADGLRGITYAIDQYDKIAPSEKNVNCSFELLKYQARTGAVGTYWTALVGGQLVHPDAGVLTAEGLELAEQFPKLPLEHKDLGRLADPEIAHRISIPFDDLVAWGRRCHLVAAERSERRQLGEALTADDRRELVSRALVAMKDELPDTWELRDVQRLGKTLSTIPRAAELGLPVVVEAIVRTEQFHEAILAVFEILLWWGTMKGDQSVTELVADGAFYKATDRCRETAQSLRKFRESCERPEIREAVEGLAGFCYQVDRCGSARDVMNHLLARHRSVQSGKNDGGIPKQDWVSLDGAKLLRPSPRFQRNEPPAYATGRALTHPYRLEPFVHMLRENDLLPRN
jgi:hypothetical protein